MSTDPLLLDIMKDIQTDVKKIHSDVTLLKVDHKEIATAFRGHVKVYESDKVRYNNTAQWCTSIDNTINDKFNQVLEPHIESISKIKEDLKIIKKDHQDIVDQYKENKYFNRISKAVYLSGGSILTLLAGGITWFIRNFDTVIK